MQAGPANTKPPLVSSHEPKALTHKPSAIDKQASPKVEYADRIAEARACLTKGKSNLNASRNTKTEIKNGVTESLERLYQLVKEAETELKGKKGPEKKPVRVESKTTITNSTFTVNSESLLALQMEEHSQLLLDNSKKMEELKETIERHKAILDTPTYASVVAHHDRRPSPKKALHSVVVTSKDETESGEEVLDRVRKAVDAKEGWVKVERVRKAKDRKIIMGFESKEDRNKVKERLEREGLHLSVEEMKNKDPLLILRDVLKINSDEDIVKALRNQNRGVFHGLDSEEDRIQIKYKRKSRNPLTCNIIISVSPTIWKRATESGNLHIDLQRVRVEDQSPLVQCTRCLGYGHGKRFCKDPADLCSHCGGPHLRSECAERLAGQAPSCRNCEKAKLEHTDHNAFSYDCPTRRRWDQLARATVAYC